MTESIIERAVAILAASPTVALPLDGLARLLGTLDPAALRRRLAEDDRFVVLPTPFLPAPEHQTPDQAAAYDRALRAAGLGPTCRVALQHRPIATPTPSVAALLRRTTALLLVPGPEADALLDAADRADGAVTASQRAGAAARSTTPLPDPP